MKKFNIRKVLDGLTAASSSSSSSSSAAAQPGAPRENDVIQETLQSEHFQLCKVGVPPPTSPSLQVKHGQMTEHRLLFASSSLLKNMHACACMHVHA